jgi:hypothetical protein
MNRLRAFGVVLALLHASIGATCDPSDLLRAIPQLLKLGGGIVEAAQAIRQLDTEARRLYPQGAPRDFTDALQICEAAVAALQVAQIAASDVGDPRIRQAIDAFRVAFVELRMAASRHGIIAPDGSIPGVGRVGDSFAGPTPTPYLFTEPYLLTDRYLEP